MQGANTLKKIILKSGILTEKEYDTYKEDAGKSKMPLEEYFVNNKIIEENKLYQFIAELHELPFVKLKDCRISLDVLFLIPEPIASKHETIAYEKEDNLLKVATINPDDIEIFEFIKKKTEFDIEVYLTSPSSLKEVLKQYHKDIRTDFEDIATKVEREEEGADTLQKMAKDIPIIRIVNSILEYAIFEGASDIHIEPTEKELGIRYRVDGLLREVMTLPKTTQSGVMARIKILANLKIDEHRLPQDGRFKIETNEYKISFRVSTMPVYDGEKIVLRLLNEDTQLLHLGGLGVSSESLETIKYYIHKPHGMILVTGPTGSGKSTTLYSMINEINKTEIDIVTVEDPIEYHLPHINQTQVSPRIGFTFALGLRSLLRQDPDVIMVGEIRDAETVEIAVHAAMTGHLVISTLHTNSAVETITRLLDMKVEPFLLSSTLNMIIGQRLVRKVCDKCKVSYKLIDSKAVKEFEARFDIKGIIKILKETGRLKTNEESFGSLSFYKGKGCKKCNETGYKGRVGIHELLEITPAVESLISRRAEVGEIQKSAAAQGMLTMMQDGYIKAKQGITTIDEVLRVTQE